MKDAMITIPADDLIKILVGQQVYQKEINAELKSINEKLSKIVKNQKDDDNGNDQGDILTDLISGLVSGKDGKTDLSSIIEMFTKKDD